MMAVQDRLPRPVFTLELHAAETGSLNFGYVDQSKYSGQLTKVPINNRTGSSWLADGVTFSSGGKPVSSRPVSMWFGAYCHLQYNELSQMLSCNCRHRRRRHHHPRIRRRCQLILVVCIRSRGASRRRVVLPVQSIDARPHLPHPRPRPDHGAWRRPQQCVCVH